jgi:hypothetical protein
MLCSAAIKPIIAHDVELTNVAERCHFSSVKGLSTSLGKEFLIPETWYAVAAILPIRARFQLVLESAATWKFSCIMPTWLILENNKARDTHSTSGSNNCCIRDGRRKVDCLKCICVQSCHISGAGYAVFQPVHPSIRSPTSDNVSDMVV